MSTTAAVLVLLVWLLFAAAWWSAGISWRAAFLLAAVTVAAFAGLGLLL